LQTILTLNIKHLLPPRSFSLPSIRVG